MGVPPRRINEICLGKRGITPDTALRLARYFRVAGLRLDVGASVLSAARAVETRLVKDRLGRFERSHQQYVAAQRKVEAAESQLRAAQARLAECDAVQDEAVETLARALVADGQPRGNPFDAFGALPPGKLTRLAFIEETQAVHQLVTAVQRNKSVSEATVQAAQAADKAARVVEQALVPVAKLQDTCRDARRTRDAVAPGWESSLGALRRGARAAADDGAPDLHAILFPPVVRAVAKTKPQQVEVAAVPTPPAAA
jgi:hypothetical protein